MSIFKCCFGKNKDTTKVYKQAKHVEKVIGNISKANKSIQLITLLDPDGQIISYVTQNDIDKDKFDSIMMKVVMFQQSCNSMAETIGFDNSKEIYLKGRKSILILTSILDNALAIYFEMNELKVEFFDCEHFIATLDDFIVNLHSLMGAEE